MLQTHGDLTPLTSKPLSRHSVVRTLRNPTSKSVPKPSLFNHSDRMVRILRSSTSKRKSAPKPTAWRKFWRRLGQPIVRRSRFWELILRACEATKLWKNTAFRAFPIAKLPRMSRVCAENPSAVKHRCFKT